MSKWVVASCCALFLSALVIPIPAAAQAVYGNIFGTVTDPSGAAVSGATVTVTDVRKGTSDTATTNAEGNYTVTHLIPDEYVVRVEAQGFKASESKHITVSADTGVRFDTALQVGNRSETLEVTAEAPQLKTDRSDVATTFTESYVENLPIINRNFTQLELATPGAQYLGWGHAALENPQGSQQIMVNGQHFSGTGYELDGTDNQDPILGIIVINPNIDAITETKMTTQNYDAEFGKAVAGIVTVQTKSGSNTLHGEGFWFRRTDATEARDPFTQFSANPVTGKFIPQDRWNQFGGTVGGPIIKNRLFFFGDYQGTRQASGFTAKVTVPTQHVRDTCLAATGLCDLSQYVPFIGNGVAGDPSTQIYNPNTGDPKTGAGRTVFPNDMIPVGLLNPAAINILKALPPPTDPTAITNNFVGSGSGPFTQNSFDTRIDFPATQTVNVFGRFSLARFSLSGTPLLGAMGGVGNGVLGLAGTSAYHNYSLASGVTKTFSSTLLADFRFGWFRYGGRTHKPDEGKDAATALGLGGLNTGSVFTSGLPTFVNAGPAIDAAEDPGTHGGFGDGLSASRCNCPLVQSEQQFQWVNNWTKIHGNHQLKWGADIRYAMNLRVPSDANRTGQLDFGQINSNKNSGVTSNFGVGGMGFASFMLGEVQNFSRFVSTTTSAAERQKRWFFYGQDTWRVTPKFTLSYGLRWEIYFPESVNGKGNGGFANLYEGVIRVAGFGPYGLNGNIDNTFKALAPRLGIAYQVTPKTVVRLGYGRSFDMGVFGSNFGHAVTQNLPVLVNQQVIALGVPNINFIPAFNMSTGPPAFTFPTIPASGQLPLGGPPIVDSSGKFVSFGNNAQPRIRPTYQRLPTLDAWNATVQRQVTNTVTVEVSYIGNKATHVFAGNGPGFDENPVPLGPGTAIVKTAGKTPNFTPATPADQRRLYFNKFVYPNYLVPLGPGGSLVPEMCCGPNIMGNYLGNDANAHYNSLQVKADKRFSHGLEFTSSYVYSHARNQSVDGGFLYAVDKKSSEGPDDFNRNHVFIWNGIYQLPFGRGKTFASSASGVLNRIIGGWTLSNTLNWASGLPFTPTIAECGSIHDSGPCLPNFAGGSFSLGAGSFDFNKHQVPYFTPVAGLAYNPADLTVGTDTCTLARPTSGPFSLPACGTNGNIGRNAFRGPGAFWDNMSLSKNIPIVERFSFEFRVDAFNVFNHPNLANPNTCVDCHGATDGKITGLGGSTTGLANNGMRYLQFGVKLMF
jgi:outer membrane receptor protein involved in Fe transport